MTGKKAAVQDARDAGERYMQVEKQKRAAHKDTRALYEEVFCEDTPAFVEYYYQNCAAENQIYTVSDQGKILAMLHLNPYLMRLGEWQGECNYIVAVATRKECRHQGLMTRLIQVSVREMHEKKQPFAFLMPAAEAIYRPFGFRFIYSQRQARLKPADTGRMPQDFWLKKAQEEDLRALSAFAGQVLSPYRVIALHTEAYFSRLLKEQECQDGEIMLIMRGKEICGYFFSSREEGLMVREAMIAPKQEAWLFPAVQEWAKNHQARLCFWPDWVKEQESLEGEKTVPLIMARVMHLETLASCLRAREPISFEIEVEDDLIPQNSGIYCLELGPGKGRAVRLQSQGSPVWRTNAADFTRLAFGCLDLQEPGISPKAAEALRQVIPLSPVMLNEIV